ncbi:GTP-binding protein [Besnoitia besnoiti]|uniref:GTP-binding protein n=1 Tax=Besnoitia besnoiti TaxID=94643 RepID=A0A2A9MKC5_BESBE|nr:GTP-binding protein [Besnoitia besnoiti]PFH38379.1 GTP-binding protein [Besnoitia besnoiti]
MSDPSCRRLGSTGRSPSSLSSSSFSEPSSASASPSRVVFVVCRAASTHSRALLRASRAAPDSRHSKQQPDPRGLHGAERLRRDFAAHAARFFSTGRRRRGHEGRDGFAAAERRREALRDDDDDVDSSSPDLRGQTRADSVQFWEDQEDTTPFLARPFVHVFQPRAYLDNSEALPWLSPEQRKYSRILFGKPIAAHPVLVAQTLHKLPHNPWPQVAVVGHSNVGKSSLLNALMHGRDVARSCSKPLPNGRVLTLPKVAPVSHLPGRTRHLFTFDLGNHLSLVDLPGYGFARVKPQLKEEWAVLIEEYFTRSRQLRRVLSLVDCTKGAEPLDEKLWQLLVEKDLPFQVVLTKADLLSAHKLHACMFNTLAKLKNVDKRETLLHPFVHAVSSRFNHGIPELRASLAAIAADARRRQHLALFKQQGREDTPVRRHR